MDPPKHTKPQDSAEVQTKLQESSKHLKGIMSERIERPMGPYSHGTVTVAPINGLVCLAGQCPIRPDGSVFQGTVAEKAKLVCENAKTLLEDAGSSTEKVIKVTVFFTDFEACYDDFNSVYVQYFPHLPARSAMQVSYIPPEGNSFEMDVIALK